MLMMVAKYCDEHVCVCLSVSEDISETTRAIFTNFSVHSLHVAYDSAAVARSSSGRVTKSQGEGVGLGVFFPTNNALYSRVFGTHTKTAEPIEMPFGMMTLVRRRYHVLDGGTDPPRHRGHIFFWGGA